jgi:hypothetical protein
MATTKNQAATASTETEEAKAKKDPTASLKNSLLSKGLTILKKNHEEEYERIVEGLFKEHGLDRVKRMSSDERKRAQLAALAAELGVEVIERVDVAESVEA